MGSSREDPSSDSKSLVYSLKSLSVRELRDPVLFAPPEHLARSRGFDVDGFIG